MCKLLKHFLLIAFERLVDLPLIWIELCDVKQRSHEVVALLYKVGFLGL
jgi:hypothetical protein